MQRELFSNVSASDDGRWLAGGFVSKQPDDIVALWDANSGRLVFEKSLGGRLSVVKVDTVTQTLAAEYLTNDLKSLIALFDLKTGACRATVTPHSTPYIGLYPEFTADGRLLIHTKYKLEWRNLHTGKLLHEQAVPQSTKGFLLSTENCNRFRIVQTMNTDPDQGIDPDETNYTLEVLTEKDGVLQGALLRKQRRVLGYTTHSGTETAAVMFHERQRTFVQVFHVPTRKMLAERILPESFEENALEFSEDGKLLYIRVFPTRVWTWQTNAIREVRPREIRDFATFHLKDREVYCQEGVIRDAKTDKQICRLQVPRYL